MKPGKICTIHRDSFEGNFIGPKIFKDIIIRNKAIWKLLSQKGDYAFHIREGFTEIEFTTRSIHT